MEEYKQKWKEINARPIKRVAEAKARKKRRVRMEQQIVIELLLHTPRVRVVINAQGCRFDFIRFLCFQMLKKMEQAKKKAEAVVNTVDISEREKMAQLKRYDAPAVQLEP